jgi:hypothetical protein
LQAARLHICIYQFIIFEAMKYLPVLLILCLFACKKRKEEACLNVPQYQVLTAAVTEWLPYTSNRSITFENRTLGIDTLQFINFFSGDEDIWQGDNCPMTKGQFTRGVIVDKKTNDTMKVQIGNTDEFRLFTKRSNLIYYDTKGILLDANAYKRFELKYTVKDRIFNTVLVLECSPTDACVPTGITKIYFAKMFGIVGYERNGQVWSLM